MNTDTTNTPLARPTPRLVASALAKRTNAVLSTVSAAGRPHAAMVMYSAVGTDLYFSTLRSSRKGRNLIANPWAAVLVPVRRIPVGPPSSIHFQGRTEILDLDDPTILRLAEAGELKAITSHGELELADGCFVRISPVGRIHTYGLGLSLRQLIRNPLSAGANVDLPG